MHSFHSSLLSDHSQVTSLFISISHSSLIHMLPPSSTDYFIHLHSTSFINSQDTFFIYYTPPPSFIHRSPHSFTSFMFNLLHSHMGRFLHLFTLHLLHSFLPLPLSFIHHLLHSLSGHLFVYSGSASLIHSRLTYFIHS